MTKLSLAVQLASILTIEENIEVRTEDNILGGGGNSGDWRPGETWGDPPGLQQGAECESDWETNSQVQQ